MSVTALSARTARHTSPHSGPGRTPVVTRRTTVAPQATPAPSLAPAPAPALTVTLAIPLIGDAMTPQAHRLLEIVRELVELGQGTVTIGNAADDARALDIDTLPVRLRPAEPAGSAPVAPTAAEPAAAADLATAPRPENGRNVAADSPEVRLLTASRQVLLDGVPLPMTRLEFDLLLFLADNPRRVFTRMQLLTAVWGYEHTGERTVDVHVRRLRVKMGVHVPLITTVYGVGYRLADDAHLVVVPHE